MLPKIIIGIVILSLTIVTFGFFNKGDPKQVPDLQHGSADLNPAPEQKPQQQESTVIPGRNKPFYTKDGIYLVHSWPGDKLFSNEETEILLLNESGSHVEVKSFDLSYSVEGKVYPHKSGTWEKYPSRNSWEQIEYLNTSKSYYQGQPLILDQNEKGKLHWHINFGPNPLDGKQTVKAKLTLSRDGQTININEEFNRDWGTVFTKEEH